MNDFIYLPFVSIDNNFPVLWVLDKECGAESVLGLVNLRLPMVEPQTLKRHQGCRQAVVHPTIMVPMHYFNNNGSYTSNNYSTLNYLNNGSNTT